VADRAAKDALYDGFAVVAKALANGRRAEIVDVLAQGERSVEEIANEIEQTVANTSQHLQQLLRTGLLVSRREGNRVHYSVAGPRVIDLWLALREVAEAHVAELDRLARAYLGDRTELETLDKSELAKRLRDGDLVVVDVRPSAEYAAGHIRGAISVPLSELTRRLRELPKSSQIVAYCRGPYCVYANDAVRTLNKRSFSAARLDDGFPEWERAGLPVARDAD